MFKISNHKAPVGCQMEETHYSFVVFDQCDTEQKSIKSLEDLMVLY